MERVHIDFCEYKGKQLLVMVDSFSKHIWCHVMNNDTTAIKTLAILYGWFCERSGFPTTLVSDNGPQFTSKEFADKMAKWGIKHILTPPYHPASNGLAEKAVGTIKIHLKKMDVSVSPIELYVNLKTILHVLSATPQVSTGLTPFELMSKAPVLRLFSQLQPKISQQQAQEKNRASVTCDKVKPVRKFQPGDSVLDHDILSKVNSNGIVKKVKSNNSYVVYVNDRDKHISGDHLSLISSDNNIKDLNVLSDNSYISDEDVDVSDTMSVDYDSDEELEPFS